MAKRHVYSKSEHGIGEFVYVDLLPEVRRPRQFNMNVIIALFVGVLAMYLLIFVPVTNRTIELEELHSWNNDSAHELTLIKEEYIGYNIDEEVISFESDITTLRGLKIDFNNLLDDVALSVDDVQGSITYVSYSAETSQLLVTVQITNFYKYNELDQIFLNRNWVLSTSYDEPTKNGDEVQYSSTFTLEVDPNVE